MRSVSVAQVSVESDSGEMVPTRNAQNISAVTIGSGRACPSFTHTVLCQSNTSLGDASRNEAPNPQSEEMIKKERIVSRMLEVYKK